MDNDVDDMPLMVFPAAGINDDIGLNEAKMIIRKCLRTIIYTQDLWFLATNFRLERGFQALQMSIDQMKQLFNLVNITEQSLKGYFGISGHFSNNNVYIHNGIIFNLTNEGRLAIQNLINEQIHQHVHEWNNHIFTAMIPLPNGINHHAHVEGRKGRKKSKSLKRTAGKRKQTKNKRNTRRQTTKKRGCTLQTSKKYTSRPSPPYPANECKQYHMFGNDGHRYRSVGNKNGVFTWKRV